MANTPTAGLEDVVAGTSDICFIDGVEGRLVYAGYNIHELVAHSSFEETVYLLWHTKLPTKAELAAFELELRNHRALPIEVLDLLAKLPRGSKPMDVLRTAVSLLGLYDPDKDDNSYDASVRKALRLVAQLPTIVTSSYRLSQGQQPVAPNPKLGHAANFLYMLRGTEASAREAEVFDDCLILHADHELNASTFSARVTAGTLSDVYSAITSAVGTLKGPLHGGANEQVIRMLLEIKTPDVAPAWITQALADKRRIMGFGHRVYRTEDPRATHLRQFSEELGKAAGQPQWYEMSRIIEKEVLAQKHLFPNVDFYSASTYYTMGIPIDLFTPIFAVSRISGWTAHVLEQYRNNRLIRPRAEYTGATHLSYVPIANR